MKKSLRTGSRILAFLMALLFAATGSGQATLMHSYTFEDGTAGDAVGDVDGTLHGDSVTIAGGLAIVSGAASNTDGYISFDAAALALNTYDAITLEAYLETGNNLNLYYALLAYFGAAEAGTNYFLILPVSQVDQTWIETKNSSTTISARFDDYELDDGWLHHVAAVLSPDRLAYYLEGNKIAETSTEGVDYISTLGADVARLFKGPDEWPDPNYNGALEEFNIYKGELSDSSIKQHADNYFIRPVDDANLDTIYASHGELFPEFDPGTVQYILYVPAGYDTIVITAEPSVSGAVVEIYDQLGYVHPDGKIVIGDGIDVEIVVTAPVGFSLKSYYLSIEPGTQIDEPEYPGIRLYPNPARDMIVVETDDTGNNITLELMDASGKILQTIPLNKRKLLEIDLSDKTEGLYFIRAKEYGGYQKIILN